MAREAHEPRGEDADGLFEAYMQAGTRALRRARERLGALPLAALLEPAVRALREAATTRAYSRAAWVLARRGGEEAFAVLLEQARAQRRFPRLSVRALAGCDHPQRIPALIELMSARPRSKRHAATEALARIGGAIAIEPLCRAYLERRRDMGGVVVDALRSMGPADALARLLLSDARLTTADRVRALRLLGEVPLGMWSFRPRRFLERAAAARSAALAMVALQAHALLIAPQTLLRSSSDPDMSTLLRSAGGPAPADATLLLRSSDGAGSEDGEDEEDEGGDGPRGGRMRRLLGALGSLRKLPRRR
ncbi:MAG: hypothetical protein IT208_19030 [Chthonomonadales bacterium]|nr:hypothetical protein [Chthonomonadales bacterium]